MDAFASKGVLFRHAYATSPWTLPSHVSMFTGVYPDTHGVDTEQSALKKDADTLAARLKRHGYQTGAIVCAPLLSKRYGMHHGFDYYDTELVGETAMKSQMLKVGPSVTRKALEWLGSRGRGPFFLFLHYWDVHYDYNPPKQYTDIFDPDYRGNINGLNIYHRTDVPSMKPRDFRHLTALYDGEIRYTDDAIGVLLDGLARLGLDKSTMIWITADHGEEFVEHGGTGHTTTCFEELVRIPMIARVPWLKSLRPIVDEPVSLIDLFPTFLDLLDVDRNDLRVQGRSILPTMQSGEPQPPRYLMAETTRGRIDQQSEVTYTWTAMLTNERQKLHQLQPDMDFLLGLESTPGKDPKYMLFNLVRDSNELQDLAAKNPVLTVRLKKDMQSRQHLHLRLKESIRVNAETELDPEFINTLRGLGYLH
jgi:arylsulfatase A-like enzyme